MSYPYFFRDRKDIKNGRFVLTGHDYRHLVNVLRSRAGDRVEVSDNEKYRYFTSIGEIGRHSAELIIENKVALIKRGPRVALFQCILKRNAMEMVIQKATEIGAATITPVFSSRVVPGFRIAEGKLDRWQKIADEASMQCKRDFRCIILPPTGIPDIKLELYDIFFLPYEHAGQNGDNPEKMIPQMKKSGNIAFIVGPEGGFTRNEVLDLNKKGAIPLSLGKNILRAETASIYFLSVLDFLLRA